MSSTTTEARSADELRRVLLDRVASAPDDLIVRHAVIVRDALGCPSWCVKDHTGAEEVDGLSSHASADVYIDDDYASTHRLRVSLSFEEDWPLAVCIDDNRLTSDQARELARVLVEHADRIDGQPARPTVSP